MPYHLDAFSDAPDVQALNGEVLILGAQVSAAYTTSAAELLIERLKGATQAARAQERQAAAEGRPAHLRLVQ